MILFSFEKLNAKNIYNKNVNKTLLQETFKLTSFDIVCLATWSRLTAVNQRSRLQRYRNTVLAVYEGIINIQFASTQQKLLSGRGERTFWLIYYNRALERIKHFFDKRAAKTAQNKQRPICLPGSATFQYNERETCAWFYCSVSCRVRTAVLRGCSTNWKRKTRLHQQSSMPLALTHNFHSDFFPIIVQFNFGLTEL